MLSLIQYLLILKQEKKWHKEDRFFENSENKNRDENELDSAEKLPSRKQTSKQ
jgi:hypothetical protein